MNADQETARFTARAQRATSVGLSPRWVHYSGISTQARAVAELLADLTLNVHGDNAQGELDREYLAYFAGLGRADRIKPYLAELVDIGFLSILDGGTDPKTGRRRQRRDATGRPLPDLFVISLEPPSGYVGPRNATEAMPVYTSDRDAAYRAAEKAGKRVRAGHVTINRTEFGRVENAQVSTNPRFGSQDVLPQDSTGLRSAGHQPSDAARSEDVARILRTIGWNARGIEPSASEFQRLVTLACDAVNRYGATADQVGWFAARKLFEAGRSPMGYLLGAFEQYAADIAYEQPPGSFSNGFVDDPELVSAFAKKTKPSTPAREADTSEQATATTEDTTPPATADRDVLPACDTCGAREGDPITFRIIPAQSIDERDTLCSACCPPSQAA